jgi:membrane fusion protein
MPVRLIGLPSWILTVFLLALLVAVALFLTTTRYSRAEHVTGMLQPAAGALRVMATRPGIVAAVHVDEGELVARNQPLVTISMDLVTPDGRHLGDVLAGTSKDQRAALQRQSLARVAEMSAQRAELRAKRAAIIESRHRLAAELDLQKERVRLAQETADASRKLFEQKYTAAVQHRQREEAVIIARQALSRLEQEFAQIPISLAQMDAQEAAISAAAEAAAASASISTAQIDEKSASTEAERNVVLVASQEGRIAALQARPGAAVTAGMALATLLPRGVHLQAELWVPSRAVGFLRRGDEVRLMYDAFPHQRFGTAEGRVVSVANAPVAPADLPEPLRTDEALYRVTVYVRHQQVRGYGKAWPLVTGMRLTADIVLEEESLWEWLLDKVRAASSHEAHK